MFEKNSATRWIFEEMVGIDLSSTGNGSVDNSVGAKRQRPLLFHHALSSI